MRQLRQAVTDNGRPDGFRMEETWLRLSPSGSVKKTRLRAFRHMEIHSKHPASPHTARRSQCLCGFQSPSEFNQKQNQQTTTPKNRTGKTEAKFGAVVVNNCSK